VAFLLPASAQAQDSLDIGSLTCKEVMLLSGSDRDATIAFLQGYVAGKSGSMTIDQELLATATDKFLDGCLDAPTERALAVLETSLHP
jgi:hypothetical protein